MHSGLSAMLTTAALLASAALPGHGQPALRADHPLIGTWDIVVPDTGCREVYRIRADGTMLVTSAQQISEAAFTVSDRPSARGFYKWMDRITRINSQKDCSGTQSPVGDEAVNYLLFHPSGNAFLMCEREDRATCVGPFNRLRDAGV